MGVCTERGTERGGYFILSWGYALKEVGTSYCHGVCTERGTERAGYFILSWEYALKEVGTSYCHGGMH